MVVTPSESHPLAEAPAVPAIYPVTPGGGWKLEFAEEFIENLECKHITGKNHLLASAHLRVHTCNAKVPQATILLAFVPTIYSAWNALLSSSPT